MPAIVNHRASVQGAVTAVEAEVGATVNRGAVLVRLESMKMEFTVEALADGVVRAVHVQLGDAVDEGDPLLDLSPIHDAAPRAAAQAAAPATRPDLDELRARRSLLGDAARPQMVDARHAQGRRTARENIGALFDAGSFVEYGAFAVAAQRSRRSLDDLQRNTPADGLVTGTGLVPPDELTLEHGDVVEIAIEGVGTLRHAVHRSGR